MRPTALIQICLWMALLCFAGYWLTFKLLGLDPLQLPQPVDPEIVSAAATAYFAGVVASQVGNVFACRTETDPVRQVGLFSNGLLIVSVGIEIAIALAAMAEPISAIIAHRQTSILLLFVGGFVLNPIGLYVLEWLRKRIARARSAPGPSFGGRLGDAFGRPLGNERR